MVNSKEKILQLVQEASLSSEEQGLWEKVLKFVTEDSSKNILLFLESVPHGFRVLTDNLKSKTDALLNSDRQKLKAIFEEEEKFINSLKY